MGMFFASPELTAEQGNVAPQSFAPPETIRERTQRHEEEAAEYQSRQVAYLEADWFFRHLSECFDPECSVCGHEDNDALAA